MSIKTLSIVAVSGVSWANLIDENGVISSCADSIRTADGFATYARVLSEEGGESGYGRYSVDQISINVVINSVTVYGAFRAGSEVPTEADSTVRLGIRTHSVVYYTMTPASIEVGPGSSVSVSKTWINNPHSGAPWTPGEVNLMQLYFQMEGGYYAEPEEDIKVDFDVGYIVIDYDPAIPSVSTKDETDITNSSAVLNGEIIDDGGGCTERGFEYYKDGDPGNVLIIAREGVFGNGDYGRTLGGLLAGAKYYFRAYALNEAGVDYGGWKNFTTTALPPTVSTSGVSDNEMDNAMGHGVINTTGGEPGVYKCIERGFEIKFEFAGGLGDYAFMHVAGFAGSVGFNMDTGNFEGTLVKTKREGGSFDAGPFELMLARMEQTVFSDMLFAGTTYSCRAYAINEDDLTGYGDWVAFTTLSALVETPGDPPDGGHVEGETTEIKNITVQNLAEGSLATRIGIRYGTTLAANEFDIHIDGIFDNGDYKFVLTDLIPGTKYYQVPYILVGHEDEEGEVDEDGGVHEGDVIESETLEEWAGPGAEFTTPHYGPHGQDYREVVEKVFAEKLSTQPIIDFSGGKKSLKIANYLIQVQSNAVVIAGNYLDRFQFAKGKLVVEYTTPMPFEREDTIDFDYGRIPFKADGEGVILFRADGQGQIKFLNMATVIVRKISLKMGIAEKVIEYLATLELEEE